MKKIAIVSKKVGIGGVERSLLSMLKNIDYNDFEVDLYLPEIDNINKIPKNVHIVKMESSLQNMFSTYFMIHPIQFFRIIFSLLLLKVNKNLNYVYQLISSKYFYKRVKKTYDVVISYDGPLGFSTFYALYNLKGKKRKYGYMEM